MWQMDDDCPIHHYSNLRDPPFVLFALQFRVPIMHCVDCIRPILINPASLFRATFSCVFFCFCDSFPPYPNNNK